MVNAKINRRCGSLCMVGAASARPDKSGSRPVGRNSAYRVRLSTVRLEPAPTGPGGNAVRFGVSH